jgi:hypothetical protein
MEPVISTVLQALAVGAQAATTGIATDEIKRTYDKLKTLIQKKWIGKPTAEKLLTAYESNPKSDENKEMLAEKLEESGIHQDQNIHRQAERLIQEVKIANSTVAVDSSRQEVLNLDRDNSPGNSYTATHGGTLDSSSRRADSGGFYNEGQYHQVTNRQTRLAVLLWLLALALTGVIGFGVYLFMNGRLQLPGQPAIPERGINSGKPPAVTEQRVSLTALNSIQGGMAFAQVEEILGVKLKLYEEQSFAVTPMGSWYASNTNIKGSGVYSCILEDGSPFYLIFLQTVKPDSFVLYAKRATLPDLTNSGSPK